MPIDINEALAGLMRDELVAPSAEGRWREFLVAVALEEASCGEETGHGLPEYKPRYAPPYAGPGQRAEKDPDECERRQMRSAVLAWELWRDFPNAAQSVLLEHRATRHIIERYDDSPPEVRKIMRERFELLAPSPSPLLTKRMAGDR